MKKTASIAAIALFAVAFTSCKKDYTCECTETDNGVTSSYSFQINNVKKKDAKTLCDGSAISIGSSTETCTLK